MENNCQAKEDPAIINKACYIIYYTHVLVQHRGNNAEVLVHL